MTNAISVWFSNLLGRPKTGGGSGKDEKKSVQKEAKDTSSVNSTDQSANGDSVQKDMEMAGNFIKRITGKLSGVLGSITPQKAVLKIQKATTSSGKTNFDGFKKLIYPLMVLTLILVIFYVGLGIYRSLRKDGDGGDGRVATETTTPVVYRPQEASVYANDFLILQIETDINVLFGEMSTKVLKESTLIPPRLDFNINFD